MRNIYRTFHNLSFTLLLSSDRVSAKIFQGEKQKLCLSKQHQETQRKIFSAFNRKYLKPYGRNFARSGIVDYIFKGNNHNVVFLT